MYRTRVQRGDDRGTVGSRSRLVATGPFQTPSVPEAARYLSGHVAQLHSSEYLRPAQLPNGTVLVVGGGNSGYQIALELVHSGRTVHLSRGSTTSACRSAPWAATIQALCPHVEGHKTGTPGQFN
ncbi:NAD(P)-binding domain-containing protein [Promicromonospora umidemergens]|uniref:NAD(P)-binding domain-containing protein n=1 Tax=Promicromonospora umidemergens TaxID=629679 RepID=UPI003CD0B071